MIGSVLMSGKNRLGVTARAAVVPVVALLAIAAQLGWPALLGLHERLAEVEPHALVSSASHDDSDPRPQSHHEHDESSCQTCHLLAQARSTLNVCVGAPVVSFERVSVIHVAAPDTAPAAASIPLPLSPRAPPVV
jgi:hypothetical protein